MPSLNLSRNGLKIIAIVLMIIDHLGAIFFPELVILRAVGRLSFSLFAYLIADGMLRTRNQGKMVCRLLILALVSQIPFTLAFYGWIFLPVSYLRFNIFFELAIGAGLIWGLEKLVRKKEVRFCILGILFLAGFFIGSKLSFIQYGYYGILMILFFYISQKHKEVQMPVFFIVGLLLLSILFDFYNRLQWLCAFAGFLLPMREVQSTDRPIGKWAYWIYPAHLMIFALIKNFL